MGGATTVALSVTLAAGSATAAPGRHPLHGSKPSWMSHARHTGAVPDKSTVSFGVVLSMRDQAGAARLVKQLSDPSSASYQHWLSSKQFRARFAPDHNSVAAVQDWLRGQGFQVTGTLPSGMLVQARGTAAQIEKTFDTSLQEYKLQGHTVRSNTTELSLPSTTPSAVVGSIGGVVGVDTGSTMKEPADTLPGPPDGARYGVQPCSDYFGQKPATDQPAAPDGSHPPYAVCGYTPKQLQGAYGASKQIKDGVDGHGITVAITDAYASPTILSDANTYATKHGQPAFRHGQFRQITPKADGYDLVKDCGGNGWYGEETLDVEAVHSIAPGAKVVYIGGADCSTGLDTAWANAIDHHTADVITNSWTDGLDDIADLSQDYVDYYQQFSTEAALTGITVSFSTGDDGDHTKGNTDPSAKTAEFPADLPYVTGVGGTSVAIGADNQRTGEWGWQNAYSQLQGDTWGPAAYSSGGGGGVSQLFEQPFYQKGRVPSSLSDVNGTAMRVLPDVAMEGDPNTGMRVGETQVFPDGTYYDEYRIGGTSLSSPLFAGMMALAGDKAGHPVGFANPAMYNGLGTSALYDEVAPTSPVYQVRTDFVNGLDATDGYKYQLQTIDTQSSTLHDVPGYDDETGVGSPGSSFFSLFGHSHRKH